MINREELCIGDWGTEIVLDTEEDITTATDLLIVGTKPGGAAIEWTAVIEDTSKVKYVTIADDIDTVGTWELRARVISPVGQWTGNRAKVRVVDPGV
jgi:hypothetical protein